MEFIINSFPRSGSTFLSAAINQFHNHNAINIHIPFLLRVSMDNAKQVSLVRNPLDAVTSFMFMMLKYNQEGLDERYFVKTQLFRYSSFLEEASNNTDRVDIVMFDDLISDPHKIVGGIVGQPVSKDHINSTYRYLQTKTLSIDPSKSNSTNKKEFLNGVFNSSSLSKDFPGVKNVLPIAEAKTQYPPIRDRILSFNLKEMDIATENYKAISQKACRYSS